MQYQMHEKESKKQERRKHGEDVEKEWKDPIDK
jgi:hypothetical protein